MDLNATDPLEPATFASYLGIELLTPQQIPGLPPDVEDQLLKHDPWGWSAVTIGNALIYNPRKSPGRRASDIMHELAHTVLTHKPAQIVLSHDGELGMRSFDQQQEDEANWLAWCLLLPRDALVYVARKGMTHEEIAKSYGVTEVLVRFRISTTGVTSQVRRAGRRRP